MAKNVTSATPYIKTSLQEFLAANEWAKECEAFILIGVSIDPEDKTHARLNISNSNITHELLSYMTVTLMYHHNLKTDLQEIMIVSRDGDEK
jgi:hypothetical protein